MNFPGSFSVRPGRFHLIMKALFAALTGVFLCQSASGVNLPDLAINPELIRPYIETHVFAPTDCEVVEGCVVAGARRLLRFGTETMNIGSADVVIGSPIGNPLFHYHTCHQHYHFQQFAEYRIRNSAGNIAGISFKAGFCIEDNFPVVEGANPTAIYDCAYQGMQAGWADFYGPEITCQWIDITDVPAGIYTLELEIDPANLFAESNESNNIARVTVAIDAPSAVPPANDNFASAQVITGPSALILTGNEAATREDPDEPFHADNLGGHSIWYRWTAPSTGNAVISTDGSTFHTLLAVYHGSTLASLVLDGNFGGLDYVRTGSVSFNATAGVEYHIAVDGYDGAIGGLLLTVNPQLLKAPHVDALTRDAGGVVKLTLSGTPGEKYEVQSAQNLGTWAIRGQVANVSGAVQFTDPDAASVTQRFYRAALVPTVEPPALKVNLVGISEQMWQTSDVWVPATQSRTITGTKSLITLGCWWDDSGGLSQLPTDTNGVFIKANQSLGFANAPVQTQVCYQTTAAAGPHTVTPPFIGSSGDGYFLLLEVEGLAGNSPVRDSGGARVSHPFYGHGDPNTIQSLTVTTTGSAAQPGDLVVAVFLMDNFSNPNINITLPPGWTSLGFNNSAVDNIGYRACYRTVTATGQQSATCTWTDDSTFVAEAAIVVFKAASGCGPGGCGSGTSMCACGGECACTSSSAATAANQRIQPAKNTAQPKSGKKLRRPRNHPTQALMHR